MWYTRKGIKGSNPFVSARNIGHPTVIPWDVSFAPESGDFYQQRYQCILTIVPITPKITSEHTLPKIPMPVYIAFYRNLWYNTCNSTDGILPSFFVLPRYVRAFLFSKGVIMQTPKFLRNLLQSNKYWNKNSAEFAKANEYLEKLFPGEL